MMDAALRRRLKELEIHALRLVNSRFLGEWSSNVRGQGLEFRDLREYVVGDDVRSLDWKATARSGRPQLRRFSEDRQQTIWLAIDLSASMQGNKSRLAQEILAVLAWAAVKQTDRFGVIGFTDRIELYRNPARGEAQLWAALEDLLSWTPQSSATDLGPVQDFFLHRPSHRSTIIMISDFWTGLDTRRLGALAQRHDVLALQVLDPREFGQVPGGLCLVEDPETGQTAWVDLGSSHMNRRLQESTEADRQAVRLNLRRAGVWYASFSTGGDFLPPLLDFFHRRTEARGV